MTHKDMERASRPAQWGTATAIASVWNSTGAPSWTAKNISREPLEYQSLELHRASDDLRISLEFWTDNGKPRVIFRLVWPRHRNGQVHVIRTPYGEPEPTTAISLDASKPAETMAKEVMRRLILADAERLHLEARRRIAAAETNEDGQTALVNRIIATVPGAHVSRNAGPFTVYMGLNSHAYVLRADSPDSVRFEAFSVPADVALRILEACAKPAEAEDTNG